MNLKLFLFISILFASCTSALVPEPPKYIANPFRPEVDALLLMPTTTGGRSVVVRLVNQLPDSVSFEYVVSVNTTPIGEGAVRLPPRDPVDIALMTDRPYTSKDPFYISLYRNKNLIHHSKILN